jgi:hypothetical protein
MIKIDYTTLAKNPTLGFYEINNQVFWDKASALMAGTKLGLNHTDLHWNFNDSEFGNFDWKVEPPGDIRNYYNARAKELREKYDYLILNCSGGADSTTMLYAFINQGLHVDEVFVRHATSGTNRFGASDMNMSASNEFSEFEFAALPLLKWLKNASPNTKITVHDFSADIINEDLTWDENFIHWCGDYVTPGCVVRYTHASQKDSLNLFDKGKSVGIIFGTDKPRVYIDKNKQMQLMFVDRATHSATPAAVQNGYHNTEVELFYWHPNSMPMIAKQCHLIKRWLEVPQNRRFWFMFDEFWLRRASNRTAYESLVKGIIYPDYDLSTFQCDKPTRSVFQEWDYWINNFKDSAGYKTFMRGMMHLYKNIDHQFLTLNAAGLSGVQNTISGTSWEYKLCMSNSYCIGAMSESIITS